MESTNKRSYAVIGGGMMGMTIAYRLAKQGHAVTIYEAGKSIGGLTNAWNLGDVIWDRFYHVTLLSDTHLRDLLDEIGLEKSMKWVETKTGFFSGGKLYSMSNSLEFLKFPPLRFLQKIRLGATIFYASKIKNSIPLEKVLVEPWLRKIAGNSVVDKVWLPLLRAKLGPCYQRTSAAFIWAAINRMYAARRTGLKKEMFGYVPGGYARILERMSEVLRAMDVEIRTDHPLQLIESDRESGGNVTIHFTDNRSAEHDNVILTIPSPVISRVCPALTTEEHDKFQGIEYLGVVCASLLLKKPISPYYVTNIIDTWVPLTGVIEMSTIVDKAELGGHSLVYLPKYMAADDPGFERTDEDFQEEMLSTLERMYPEFDRADVVQFRIGRARNVMALPTLNYTENLPPVKTSLKGVYAINSAQITKGNLNVNETIQVADEAIKNMLLAQETESERTSRPVALST
jgi:protoporphyrinogen oxidase